MPFRTLVSLGPGDGSADADLVAALAGRPAYVAVDISRPLLQAAIERLRPLAGPVRGVLCDFEDDGGFLGACLRGHAEPRVLYALLGGTLGNLDRGERPLRSADYESHAEIVCRRHVVAAVGQPCGAAQVGGACAGEAEVMHARLVAFEQTNHASR